MSCGNASSFRQIMIYAARSFLQYFDIILECNPNTVGCMQSKAARRPACRNEAAVQRDGFTYKPVSHINM
jgi:hypothetical protein